MTELQITTEAKETALLAFEKDGVKSYFDYKDGKWQYWGEISVEESAKMLFEKLAQYMDKYFDLEKYKKDNE